jgi:hypothetical protein
LTVHVHPPESWRRLFDIFVPFQPPARRAALKL